MIYRSNLQAPDLQPHFKHVTSRLMPHSMGHDVLSDWADRTDDDPVFGIFKRCGFWTHDEAAILYNVAQLVGGHWLDIGAHTGWTTAHIIPGTQITESIDPMYAIEEFCVRTTANLQGCFKRRIETIAVLLPLTSDQFFSRVNTVVADGVCIDGDHCSPHPLRDAQNAAKRLKERGVIIFHDAIGAPVLEGVNWLVEHGFKSRFYYTPHGVMLCWRGDFTPPHHVRDPRINWRAVEKLMPMYDFKRAA